MADPVGPPPVAVPADPCRAAGSGAGAGALRILLAEDNRVNQRVAMSMLQRMGHQVVVANNGREALQAFGNGEYDLVLMDVQMPEVDGFEATATIRRTDAGRAGRLPIVAMTAHAMKGDRERCLEAGMDGYISKPVSRLELEKEISRVMGFHDAPASAVPREATA
jgi:CheY-like chemotaxis protein